ncbi:MAG TPA: hypothetical protein VK488_01840 [Gaiellaceae bacterium]|nr:hypothetical protein [Gaiellaceae bacterium]
MSFPRAESQPPEDRTVGQLIADSIQLYGRRFWRSLALGFAPAAYTIGAAFLDGSVRLAYGFVVGPLVLGATYVWAVRVASGSTGRFGPAMLAGLVALWPIALSRVAVFQGVYFVALAWFAFVGLAVPAVVVEGLSFPDAFRRGNRLARADFAHAFGAVAALAIIVIVSIFSLSLFLAGFGSQSVTVSAVLAVVVMSPLFFLGSALLYFDQKARLESGSPRQRRRDARLHHADDSDRAGRPDPEVKPGPAARGKS